MSRAAEAPVRVDVVDSLAGVAARDWNRLAAGCGPFLRHEYLHALETTGCVGDATGWVPRHLLVHDAAGTPVAAMPLYVKTDSWGEFVFDFAWADAYRRAGRHYYPKLVGAVPFTPVPGTRLLVGGHADPDAARRTLLAGVRALAGQIDASSAHVLFPTDEEHGALLDTGFALRKDCQFHWRNHGYADFDAMLATFQSKKRKQVRRERRIVAAQGFAFRTLTGDALDDALWQDVYALYASTFLVRGRRPYFTPELFPALGRTMGEDLLVTLAERDGKPRAMAIFFRSETTLYGRYWGAERDFDCLHFETCYYQGIEHCLREGLDSFEPGTQGEHKITRGFEPTPTWSAHWIGDGDFGAAIGDYLRRERDHVDRYIESAGAHLPFRRDDGTGS